MGEYACVEYVCLKCQKSDMIEIKGNVGYCKRCEVSFNIEKETEEEFPRFSLRGKLSHG